jgi:hypothetical protein
MIKPEKLERALTGVRLTIERWKTSVTAYKPRHLNQRETNADLDDMRTRLRHLLSRESRLLKIIRDAKTTEDGRQAARLLSSGPAAL